MRSVRWTVAGIGAVAAAAVVLAGCSSSGTGTTTPTTGGSGGGQSPTSGGSPTGGTTDWSSAQSATAGGGMAALIKAAKAEGTLNVIALPPTWANYATIIKTFENKYGIKVHSENPDGSSGDELTALKSTKGQSSAPDVVDVG
ncbi:MAG: ABC transporter substrate-binding protein, partial [Gordonia polyisoprenivorans]|nr:ABC transporter substrate-binding protein [Gordonia polyisoprenivorans]